METENHWNFPSNQEVEQVIDIILLSFNKILKTENQRRLKWIWEQLFLLLKDDKRSRIPRKIQDISHLFTDPEMIDVTMTEINTIWEWSMELKARLKSTAYWIFRELIFLERNAFPKQPTKMKPVETASYKFTRTPTYKEELNKLKNFLVWDRGIFKRSQDLVNRINEEYYRFNFSRTPATLSQVLNDTEYTMTPMLAKAIYLLIERDIINGWEQKAQIFCTHLIKTYGQDALEKMDREKRLQ